MHFDLIEAWGSCITWGAIYSVSLGAVSHFLLQLEVTGKMVYLVNYLHIMGNNSENVMHMKASKPTDKGSGPSIIILYAACKHIPSSLPSAQTIAIIFKPKVMLWPVKLFIILILHPTTPYAVSTSWNFYFYKQSILLFKMTCSQPFSWNAYFYRTKEEITYFNVLKSYNIYIQQKNSEQGTLIKIKCKCTLIAHFKLLISI